MGYDKRSIVGDKSYAFAVRIYKVYQEISNKRNEYTLSKQLMRSGTSIGANVREALNAESNSDFIHKLSIAQKECDESCYWIDLLHDTGYLSDVEHKSVFDDAKEILKIIRSIIITSKRK